MMTVLFFVLMGVLVPVSSLHAQLVAPSVDSGMTLTRVAKAGDTMTGPLVGTRIDLSNTLTASSITTTGQIGAATGFRSGSTAGATVGACGATQSLGSINVVGGLVTAGSCINVSTENATLPSLDGPNTWTGPNTFAALLTVSSPTLISSTLTVSGNAFSVGGSTLSVASGKVGIGVLAPAEMIDVYGNAVLQLINTNTSSASEGALVHLKSNDGSTNASGDRLATIIFGGNANNSVTNSASIDAFADGTWGASDAPTSLIFKTAPDGSATRAERMKIDNAGAVTVAGNSFSVGASTFVVKQGLIGMGTASPSNGQLVVRYDLASANTLLALENGITAGANQGSAIDFIGHTSLSRMGQIISAWNAAANTDAYMSFTTRGGGTNAERMRITSTGNVGIGTTGPSTKFQVSSGVITNDGTGYGVIIGTAILNGAVLNVVGKTADDYVVKFSSADGNRAFGIHQNGHLSFYGSVSTFGVCDNAGLTNDVDGAMQIVFTGANNSCAVVFGEAFDASPVCTLGAKVTTVGEQPTFSAKSATGFTLVPITGDWESGDEIDVICVASH
jgi:hypothetical protein